MELISSISKLKRGTPRALSNLLKNKLIRHDRKKCAAMVCRRISLSLLQMTDTH